MRWWKFSTILTLAAALGALGCGGSSSSGVAITITPTTASVITNRTQLFSGAVTGSSNTAITWTLTCATGVTANTCGTIDATGLYTAPATIPTVDLQRHDDDCPCSHDHGHRASRYHQSRHRHPDHHHRNQHHASLQPALPWARARFFLFTATVNNPGCNITSNPTCNNVTWSLSTTLTGIGTIGSTTGVYTAPATVPSPSSTVIITATSVADTSVTATATVTVETATTPTVTSVSPNTTALGGLFQDIYITGTNFISTENVYVNGVASWPPPSSPDVSTSVIRARIPDYLLAVPPPSGHLSDRRLRAVRAGSNVHDGRVTLPNYSGGSAPRRCRALAGQHPARHGGSSVLQRGWGILRNGKQSAAPAVSATFNGQLRAIQLPASQTIDSTRQLSVTIGGGSNSSDFTVPGLYPVAVKSATDSTKFAVTNLAVQPTYTSVRSGDQIPVGSIAALGAQRCGHQSRDGHGRRGEYGVERH